jgi:superfamily II DNA helicase RecQ
MALTASATPLYATFSLLPSSCPLLRNRVQDDIARILGMDPDRLFKFVHPFNRPNLFYEVRSFEKVFPQRI